MKELLSKIGIHQSGHFSGDDNYVIDLEGSEEFNKVFSKLDKSSEVEENEDASVVNLNVTNIMYASDEFSFSLIADFEQDTYKLVVSKITEGKDE